MAKGKRTKANVLPDWYPLPVYSQKLTKAQWLNEIVMRMALRKVKENEDDGLIEKAASDVHLDRFLSLIVTAKSRNRESSLIDKDDKLFWPIRHPTPFEMYYMTETQRDPSYEEAERWAKELAHGDRRKHVEFASGPGDAVRAIPTKDLSEERLDRLREIMYRRVPLLVDLDHDDHTLNLAFKVWLIGARALAQEKARHPIGEKEFSKWKKFGLLPSFDLLFWARITGQPYTDVFLAHTLWPDNKAHAEDFADITERFRKVTRPMVEEVFGWPYVAKLWAQVNFEAALDRLVARAKRNKTEGKSIPESGNVIKLPRTHRPRKTRRK